MLGLTMLARLDLIFLGVALCGFCMLQAVRRGGHERHAWAATSIYIVLGASVVCIPYLSYNMYHFGAFAPVSVHLKSSFPHISYTNTRLLQLGLRPTAIAAVALAYLVWMLIAMGRRGARATYHRVALTVLSLSIVLHFVHTLLFVRWAVFDWHFVPYAFFAVLMPSEPVAFLGRYLQPARYPKLVALATLILVMAMAPRIVRKTLLAPLDSSFRVRSYQAALWVRDNTLPTDVFAMKDAGHFGFFSERSTINLDGVVNNEKYQEALRDQQLDAYLKRHDVHYLVQHNMKRGDRTLLADVEWADDQPPESKYLEIALRYKSQLFGVYSDPITVRSGCEVYRSTPYPSPRSFLPLVIWRIAGCDLASSQ
jgi:hypothetical protein